MSLNRLWEALTERRADEDEPADRPLEVRLPTAGPLTIRRDVEGGESGTVSLLGASGNVVSFRASSPLLPDQRIVIETIARQFEAVVRQVEQDGFSYLVRAEILPRDAAAAKGKSKGMAAG